MADKREREPYTVWPAGSVIEEENDLVGRDEAIGDICNRLAGRSVILAAPRRVGKTCVAREVLRRLAADGYLTASIDFFRVTSKRAFAESLTRQLLEASTSLRSRMRRVGSAMRGMASGVKPYVQLAETEFGIQLARMDEDEDRLFQQALELPRQLSDRENRHVVIFMDEFQEADSNLGANVYRIMRSYFQEQRRVQQLFAGSRATLLRKLFTAPGAALLRYAVEVKLPWPSAPDWTAYIVRKYTEAGVACSPGLAQSLVEVTAGHPADTMELCQALHIAAIEAGTTDLSPDLLNVAAQHAEEALSAVFDEIWDDLGDTRYARRIAQRIAQDLPPYGSGLHSQSAGSAIDALLDKGVVERHGRGQYRFPEPLFERYVRRMVE